MILPSIKAKYDNYTQFNYTRRKQSYVTRMYTVFTRVWSHQFYSFVLMMLSSPESEKSIRLVSTEFTVLRLSCIG